MIDIKLSTYNPVNDLFLLETESLKDKKEDFETTTTGIIVQKKSIIESREVMGKIVKMGPNANKDYKIGDTINFYANAGIDIIFSDSDKIHLIIGEEKFLGVIKGE